jgi:hypothetical protein
LFIEIVLVAGFIKPLQGLSGKGVASWLILLALITHQKVAPLWRNEAST